MNLLDWLLNMEQMQEECDMSNPSFWPEGTSLVRYDYPVEFLTWYPLYRVNMMDIEMLAEKSNTAVSVVEELIRCLEVELIFEGFRKYFILN